MRLNKPTRVQSYQAITYEQTARSPQYADRLQALLDGRDVTYYGFDKNDDQASVVGARVAVMWVSQHQCVARPLPICLFCGCFL